MGLLLAAALLTSGLQGVVTRGPTQPVCRVGTPCSAPAVGVELQFWRRGRLVSDVRTGDAGRYAVRLAPGTYTVRLSPPPTIGAGLRPALVRVSRGVVTRADFYLDTGIR
jgi:hypothetical protein